MTDQPEKPESEIAAAEDAAPEDAAPEDSAPEAAAEDTAAAEVAVSEAVAPEAVVADVVAESVEEEAAEPEVAADPHAQSLRLIEALLFASAQPLDASTLAERLPKDTDIDVLLAELAEMYAGRGVNLVRVAGGFIFRTAPDLAQKLRIETQVTRKLSRAAVETLAIIAYHQPVTRAEIEQIRGVSISKGTLDFLFEQTWIKPMGRRRAPGKPVTWGTTDFFLEHFGLATIDDLPGMEELKAAGLLDQRAQPSIYRPEEPDLPLTDEGEDGNAEPLEAGEDVPVKAAD